jgi:hypothetical protein
VSYGKIPQAPVYKFVEFVGWVCRGKSNDRNCGKGNGCVLYESSVLYTRKIYVLCMSSIFLYGAFILNNVFGTDLHVTPDLPIVFHIGYVVTPFHHPHVFVFQSTPTLPPKYFLMQGSW